MTTVSAVVLAAGLSSRMGGPHKLLLDVGGEPMLRRVVRSVLGLNPAEVVVVTGYRADDVKASLDGLPVRFVHNPDFADGQPGSVLAGVRALTVFCHAMIIVLGDQPLLTPPALSRLIEAYATAPTGRSMKIGGGRLIETYPDEVALTEMADDAFTQDCDTPEDYVVLQARLGIAP
jgi:molybdenum cofactor cytidylyltransferase